MDLDDVLQNVYVKAPMAAKNKAEAIDELCSLIANERGLREQWSGLSEAVRQRLLAGGPQELKGVVIPHGSSPLIGTPCLAIGKCSQAMDWEGKGNRNIRLICMLIVPQGETSDRLTLELGQMLNCDAILDRLHHCASQTEFRDFFRRVGKDLDVPDGFQLEGLIGKHPDSIQAIAWAPEGDIIATGAAHHDYLIRLWRENGDLHGELRGHTAKVYSVAWSSDGEFIAAGSEDRTACIWQLADRSLVRVLGAGSPVHGVAWSPGGEALALASHLGVRLFDTKSWRSKPALAGVNIVPAFAACWSPDGFLLAAAGGRGYAAVQLWEGSSPRTVARLELAKGHVSAIAWSPDSSLLAVGDGEGTIHIWNRDKWQTPLESICAHRGRISSLAFSFDGTLLASRADDGTLKLWRVRGWTNAGSLLDPTNDTYLGAPLSFHPDRLRLATLGRHGDWIRIWRIKYSELRGDATDATDRNHKTPSDSIRVPGELVDALQRGHAVLFAGAGISAKWLGITTRKLLDELAADIRRAYPDYDTADRPFEVVADEYEAVFDLHQLTDRISQLIPQCPGPSPQHIAAALAFRTIITTNWDLLFEEAYRTNRNPAQVISSNDEANTFRHDRATVIKMHGSAEKPATIIATANQYELYHRTHATLLAKLAELLRDKVVLFAGYGMRDEHVRRLVSSIRQEQARWAKHVYMVGFFDEVRTKLLQSRGIEVLGCDIADFLPELQRRAESARQA